MENGLLFLVMQRAAKTRTSFYADDTALFINPVDGLMSSKFLWALSGLKVNLGKCVAYYPIRCENLDTSDILSAFGGRVGSLPCKYLVLPLSTRLRRQVELEP